MIQIDILILTGGRNRRTGGHFKGDFPLRSGAAPVSPAGTFPGASADDLSAVPWDRAADRFSETFLGRLVDCLGPHTETLRLSGRTESGRDHGIPVVPDRFPGCGPLAGLHAGLSTAVSDWTAAAACDMPFLTWELYEFLLAQLEAADAEAQQSSTPPAAAVIPVLEGHFHPLAALYHRSLAPVFEAALLRGDRKIRIALEGQNVLLVPLDERPELAVMLTNINTAEDYSRYLGR